ncbi:MAG: BTAD domain-containing putative transcriptional regulator [Nocardioides sp.]
MNGSAGGAATLQLLGWWRLSKAGAPLQLGGREQRLTALLALRGPRPRVLVASTLWPDTREDRARASLRTAIKRTEEHAPGLLEADRWTVGLSRRVRVDVHVLLRAIAAAPARQRQDPSGLLSLLECEELLPGWYDDWVLYEREKLEQQKIRTLENLATSAYDSGDWVTALDAAREASRREPLLDAMRSIVIRARLSLGDVSGAVHEYRRYRRFLALELGIEPPAELASLFDGTGPSRLPRVDAALLPSPRRPRRTSPNPLT